MAEVLEMLFQGKVPGRRGSEATAGRPTPAAARRA